MLGSVENLVLTSSIGTWENSDSTNLKNDLAAPSNITRIARAIKPLSSDGIPQIVYYHWGVGGLGGFTQKLKGATGGGKFPRDPQLADILD